MVEKDDVWLIGYGEDELLPETMLERYRQGADLLVVWEGLRIVARALVDLREQGVRLEVPAQPHAPYLDN